VKDIDEILTTNFNLYGILPKILTKTTKKLMFLEVLECQKNETLITQLNKYPFIKTAPHCYEIIQATYSSVFRSELSGLATVCYNGCLQVKVTSP